MEFSNLYNLIKFIEYGTRLRIGILFFGLHRNEKLLIPYSHQIHSAPVCLELKSRVGGYEKCFACRNAAIDKAINTKTAFGGRCINGVYEYTHPIVINNNVFAIIYIGNILRSNDCEKIKRLLNDSELISTMEYDFSEDKCKEVTWLIESYIRLLIKEYPVSNESGYEQLIENLKNMIDLNLEYDISLTLIAKSFGYNEKYLGRLFKSRTGISFKRYVNEKRISRAKSFLLNSNMTVIAVSEKVGFNNVTYFNHVFKEICGVSPIAYREKHCLTK